ncbi:MAG: hypothetical protein WDW38_005952 [Sanguina aurantia]
MAGSSAAGGQFSASRPREDAPAPFHVPRSRREEPSEYAPFHKPARSPQPANRTSPSPPPPTHPRPARPNRSYTGLHSPLSKLRSSSVPAVHLPKQPNRTASPLPDTRAQPSPPLQGVRPQAPPPLPQSTRTTPGAYNAIGRGASRPPPAIGNGPHSPDHTVRTISFELSPGGGGGGGASWAPTSRSFHRAAAGASGLPQPLATKFAPGVWPSPVPPAPSAQGSQPANRRSTSPTPHHPSPVSRQLHPTLSLADSHLLMDMDPHTFDGLNPEQLTLLHDIMAAGPIDPWPASLADGPDGGSITFAPHTQLAGAHPGMHGSRLATVSVGVAEGSPRQERQQRSSEDRRALASPRWRRREVGEGWGVRGAAGRAHAWPWIWGCWRVGACTALRQG